MITYVQSWDQWWNPWNQRRVHLSPLYFSQSGQPEKLKLVLYSLYTLEIQGDQVNFVGRILVTIHQMHFAVLSQS